MVRGEVILAQKSLRKRLLCGIKTLGNANLPEQSLPSVTKPIKNQHNKFRLKLPKKRFQGTRG